MTGDGLRVVFEPVLDGGGFPGALGGRAACFGEHWAGEQGFLEILETRLGLGGRWPGPVERAVEISRHLAGQGGFWRRSFEADALGCARRLLRDRDALRLWGWRGEPISPRLAELASATAAAPPGLPDRLAAVAAALPARRPAIAAVALAVPEETLPTLWRQVLAGLRAAGVAVESAAIPPAPASASSDLWRARDRGFAPRGDGSLILLRPHGPLAAAEEIAGALAASDSLDGVAVLGCDEALAAALVRCGLPRPRRRAEAPASIEAIALLLEALFDPADPADIYALLALDPGPVPRPIAWRLARALDELPGRGSAPWRDALAAGLADLDEARRERARARVTGLLEPCTPRGGRVEVAEVRRRLALLSSWARGLGERRPSVLGAALAAESLSGLLETFGAATLDRVELRRLAAELEPPAAAGALAEAGVAGIGHPGGVLGPARAIVWWDFTAASARRPQRVRLSAAERAAFAAAGIPTPDPRAAARAEALRWRRPLEQAGAHLILVCPETDASGERSFPHPLWDELAAAMDEPAHAARLVRRRASGLATPSRRRPALRPLPRALGTWLAKAPVMLRDRESPSGLETLLGCSLAWTLSQRARLRRRWRLPRPPGPWLFGKLAHAVLAAVFEGGAIGPEDARARAAALIESELPAWCETLGLPRYQLERALLVEAIALSAADLAALIEGLGATVRGVELELTGDLDGLPLGGRADLVLADPDVVIDLKWGQGAARDKLSTGSALQLAAYADMTGASPEVAYYIASRQRLLGGPGTALPGAEAAGEHAIAETWRGAAEAVRIRAAELARGQLTAPGATADPPPSSLEGGVLTIAPGCDYCELASLCGRRGAA